MTRKPEVCRAIEPALIAVGSVEADPAATAAVDAHVHRCAPCREELERYQGLHRVVGVWRAAPPREGAAEAARARLESRLTDLRRRRLVYRIFSSPLGRILLARSEEGVSLVEYLGEGEGIERSRLMRLHGVDAVEDGADVESLARELLDYVEGRRTRLEWRLDLRLARSEFHRAVLRATAAIPYGAVTSYVGLAADIGRPRAVRAVAQALRWNPLPIVVPCHRVVGASGALTGYAGDRLALKERLLALEGVRAEGHGRALHIRPRSMYVLFPNGTEYCLPTCPSVVSEPGERRVRLFASRERAEAAGLTPCTTCRPDLHPLAA